MWSNNRYQHLTDITASSDPQAYKQGQEQARVSLERYHYLCAAATKKFSIPGRPGQSLPFYRDELDFSAYAAYPLENIPGVQIHVPSRDSTVHPRDIDPYVGLFRRSWKCRQGGIMYCIEHDRDFWNTIMHFFSGPRTTRIDQWDDILNKLRLNGPNQGAVPCMVRPQAHVL